MPLSSDMGLLLYVLISFRFVSGPVRAKTLVAKSVAFAMCRLVSRDKDFPFSFALCINSRDFWLKTLQVSCQGILGSCFYLSQALVDSSAKTTFNNNVLQQLLGWGLALDSPSVEFAGDSRRWARRRTLVLQTPTNKEDPANSADPKGQKEKGNTAVAHASAR
jgi:hypothetical protein